MAREGFKALDTNNNGSLSYDEIKVGIDDLAKSQNHTLTDTEWEWIKETGAKIDTKTPGKVDEHEFWEFANAVFKHFKICHLAREEEREEHHERKGCLTHKMTREGFHELDTNNNGSLSYDEIKVGLEELAKSQNHTITDTEWEWIKETGSKIDSKTPGKVDEHEFFLFANAIFEHFGLCHLVDGDDHEDHGDHNCDLSATESAEVFK